MHPKFGRFLALLLALMLLAQLALAEGDSTTLAYLRLNNAKSTPEGLEYYVNLFDEGGNLFTTTSMEATDWYAVLDGHGAYQANAAINIMNTDARVHYFLLVDVSRSGSRELNNRIRNAAKKFCALIAGSGRKNEVVTVITFGTEINVLSQGENVDIMKLNQALDSLEFNDNWTHLNDAVAYAVGLARQSGDNAHIIVLSDGINDVGDTPNVDEATRWAKLDTLIPLAQGGAIPVYFLVNDAQTNKDRQDIAAIERFTDAIGGITFDKTQDADMDMELSAIRTIATSAMVIGVPMMNDGSFNALERVIYSQVARGELYSDVRPVDVDITQWRTPGPTDAPTPTPTASPEPTATPTPTPVPVGSIKVSTNLKGDNEAHLFHFTVTVNDSNFSKQYDFNDDRGNQVQFYLGVLECYKYVRGEGDYSEFELTDIPVGTRFTVEISAEDENSLVDGARYDFTPPSKSYTASVVEAGKAVNCTFQNWLILPTPTPTEEPTPEPTAEPTATPTPTVQVVTPPPIVVDEATTEPVTPEPTVKPTMPPTPVPTEVPTPEPTEQPGFLTELTTKVKDTVTPEWIRENLILVIAAGVLLLALIVLIVLLIVRHHRKKKKIKATEVHSNPGGNNDENKTVRKTGPVGDYVTAPTARSDAPNPYGANATVGFNNATPSVYGVAGESTRQNLNNQAYQGTKRFDDADDPYAKTTRFADASYTTGTKAFNDAPYQGTKRFDDAGTGSMGAPAPYVSTGTARLGAQGPMSDMPLNTVGTNAEPPTGTVRMTPAAPVGTPSGTVRMDARPAGIALTVQEKRGDVDAPHNVMVDSQLIIGRQAPAQLIIRDEKVSTRHAKITREGDALFIADMGSTNGTKVNKERLSAQPRQLHSGDTITMGMTTLTVTFDE